MSGNMYNTKTFIAKAMLKRGNTYDYSKVDYVNYKTKIIIICPIHGKFKQVPSQHLYGQECPECGEIKKRKGRLSTIEEWIKKAKLIHGNKYDYSNAIYIGSVFKIEIVCKNHGSFWQEANSHLQGEGCYKCGGSATLNTQEFIEKAMKVHGDKYDYSKVDYKNNREKIIIICKLHGEFKQQPSNHLIGKGCLQCYVDSRISKGEIEWLNYLNVGQRHITISKWVVDGYDPQTLTIYEYLGDYFHGNPNYFKSDIKIARSNKTTGEAYIGTWNRFNDLMNRGFDVKYIWEHEWNDAKKTGNVPILHSYNEIKTPEFA